MPAADEPAVDDQLDDQIDDHDDEPDDDGESIHGTMPTAAEIERHCEVIAAGWSPRERDRRAFGRDGRRRWTAPRARHAGFTHGDDDE
jgi:hypothetical protein